MQKLRNLLFAASFSLLATNAFADYQALRGEIELGRMPEVSVIDGSQWNCTGYGTFAGYENSEYPMPIATITYQPATDSFDWNYAGGARPLVLVKDSGHDALTYRSGDRISFFRISGDNQKIIAEDDWTKDPGFATFLSSIVDLSGNSGKPGDYNECQRIAANPSNP